jgi:hypothetical protein
MKLKTLLFVVLLSSVLFLQNVIYAQNVFPYGVFLNGELNSNSTVYQRVTELGMNTVIQIAPYNDFPVKSYLNQYQGLIVENWDADTNYINYYARGYYKKWESEDSTSNTLTVGVKHNRGRPALFNPDNPNNPVYTPPYNSWEGNGSNGPILGLVKGPDYRQDKNDRMWDPQSQYIADFYLAYLPRETDPDNNIFRIGIRYKYLLIENNDTIPTSAILKDTIITLKDTYQYFTKYSLSYDYKNYISNQYIADKNPPGGNNQLGGQIDDTYPGTGIEFFVDLLGTGTLYSDYVEVFDDKIWKLNFMSVQDRSNSFNNIINFANKYSYNYWNNIKYFYATDEPQTIDLYEPLRLIDSVLRASTYLQKGIFTTFQTQWNGTRNGESTTSRFKNSAQLEKIAPDYYPFWADNHNDEWNFNIMREVISDVAQNDKNFWYIPQAFGERYNGNYVVWRKPDTVEFNASIMLALAQGAKGLIFWKLITSTGYEYNCDCTVTFDAITGEYPDFSKTDMYWYLYYSLRPRLTGKLGNILPNLEYTGKSLHTTYHGEYPDTLSTFSIIPPYSPAYLTLKAHGNDYDWHAGLFNHILQSQNKFFMLINLRTDGSREAKFTITPFSKNIRIRDYENPSSFDNVIHSQTTFTYIIPAGEGRLFQVAPSINYGGIILADDSVSSETALYDSLIIAEGTTLVVDAAYNIHANIVIEPGGKLIVTPNGHLNFDPGYSLYCPKLKLTALIQGFYNDSIMVPDTVKIEIHNSVSPYSLVDSFIAVLDSTGFGTFYFTSAHNDSSYYLVFKHRNSIETWSAAPHYFTFDTLTYNFTTDSTKAYGNNMIKKNGKWCIYSGDVNQDGVVDSGDLGLVNADVSNYITGYARTDINGDEMVDSNDSGIVDNNNSNYVGKIVPEGASAKVIRHLNQQRKIKTTSQQ